MLVDLNKKGESDQHASNPTLHSGLATDIDKPEAGKGKETQGGTSSRVIFDRVSPPNAASVASSAVAIDSAAGAKTYPEPAVTYADGQGAIMYDKLSKEKAKNPYTRGVKERTTISEVANSLTTENVLSDKGGARAHLLNGNQQEKLRKASMPGMMIPGDKQQ